jgi:hypothetical protein
MLLKNKEVIKNLLVMLVGFLIAFIIIESYFQIRYTFLSKIPGYLRITELRYFDLDGTPHWIPNSQAWHPSADGKQEILININRFGFRGKEPDLSKNKNRIVIIGDSIPFGGAVESSDRFSELLENKLIHKNKNSEVINLAVGDINLSHYLKILKNTAIPLEPKIVVLTTYGNDWATIQEEQLGDTLSTYDKSIVTPTTFQIHTLSAIKREIKKLRILFSTKAQERFSWGEAYQKGIYKSDKKIWLSMLEDAKYDWGAIWQKEYQENNSLIIKQIIELTRKQNILLYWVHFPVGAQIEIPANFPESDTPEKYLISVLNAEKVNILNLLSEFKYDKSNFPYYDQCHLTKNGHANVAKLIYKMLLTN